MLVIGGEDTIAGIEADALRDQVHTVGGGVGDDHLFGLALQDLRGLEADGLGLLEEGAVALLGGVCFEAAPGIGRAFEDRCGRGAE